MNWRVMPIRTWPKEETRQPRDHPFRRANHRGVDWMGTQNLLERELDNLDAKDIILQMWLSNPARDIRLDGWIRADASPYKPGVILTFEIPDVGTVNYPVDTFNDWQANVRAIAIGLEDLRRLERYGVASKAQQYTGWKALPERSSFNGYAILAAWAGWDEQEVREKPSLAWKAARRRAHPDADGSAEAFANVEEAARILGLK